MNIKTRSKRKYRSSRRTIYSFLWMKVYCLISVNPCHVANLYKLSSLVAKCSILYFAGFLNSPLRNMSCFAELNYFFLTKYPLGDDSTFSVFFIIKFFIRKWASKTQNPLENVKKISNLGCLSRNFEKRWFFLEPLKSYIIE